MDLQLTNKRCLVTGASAGIGDGIARCLAREGVQLAITARREERLEALADELERETGKRPLVVVADLMQLDARELLRDRLVEAFGGIDVLVNNAGLSSPPTPIASDATWNASFDLKFTTVRRLTNAFLPLMQSQGWDRVINITGIVEPMATSAALTACAAVHAWAKGLSRDFAGDGITVNCVPPGRIDSEQIRERLHPDPIAKQAFIERPYTDGPFRQPSRVGGSRCFLSFATRRLHHWNCYTG